MIEKPSAVQKAKLSHDRASKERESNQRALRALYLQNIDNLVVQDILEKAKSFAEYHTKIARDGVGSQKTGEKYENGIDIFETVFFTNEKRVTELDKAAGILELSDYIERQLISESEKPRKNK